MEQREVCYDRQHIHDTPNRVCIGLDEVCNQKHGYEHYQCSVANSSRKPDDLFRLLRINLANHLTLDCYSIGHWLSIFAHKQVVTPKCNLYLIQRLSIESREGLWVLEFQLDHNVTFCEFYDVPVEAQVLGLRIRSGSNSQIECRAYLELLVACFSQVGLCPRLCLSESNLSVFKFSIVFPNFYRRAENN